MCQCVCVCGVFLINFSLSSSLGSLTGSKARISSLSGSNYPDISCQAVSSHTTMVIKLIRGADFILQKHEHMIKAKSNTAACFYESERQFGCSERC